MIFSTNKDSSQIPDDLFLMARIVDHTPISIMVTTTDGVILYVNSCAVHDLNFSRDSLKEMKVESIVSDTGEGLSWSEIRERLLRDKNCVARAVLICKGGAEITSSLHGFSIDHAAAKTAVFILQFIDITDDLKSASQLEKKNLEMAKINSELIRSNAELKRVSELKSNFLSIASHELKTPLTSIKGYSDIIIDTMKDKIENNIFRMIESINRAADRLHRVVNNILDVTRIEQKRLRLKPEQLDLASVARECIEELSHFSAKRNIHFECVVQERLPKFLGDNMRMQQVFTNLFSNALKFSPDHSTVTLSIGLLNPMEFHLVVKDNGIGIDKLEQKKIFDPFYEVGNTNRHSTDFSKFMGGGTGLGLSIVKGIVERHGGRIWVESEGPSDANKFPGSEFHVVIPVKSKIDWDDDETRIIKLAEINEEQIRGRDSAEENVERKPVILFIDSDREAIEISKMVLENAFDILVAETGEIGLSMAFEHLPSVILVDSYLPGLDGYRVCRILRSQEETKNISIAFFSAGSQRSEIQKCFASGGDDFIVKPFSGKELVEKIWRLLMKKKEKRDYQRPGIFME
jgi:two-component system, sensor histidine kinase ChiS